MIDEKEARAMTREQALHALANAENVDPATRRTARMMLAGPQVAEREQGRRPRLPVMVASVSMALYQIGNEYERERAEALAEVRELAGGAL